MHQLRLDREDKANSLLFFSLQLHKVKEIFVLELGESQHGIVEDRLIFNALTSAQVNSSLKMSEDEVGSSPNLAFIPVEGLEIEATVKGRLILKRYHLFLPIFSIFGEG